MADYAVQYVPEEHAPDPVPSHGDPAAPGKLGIWLFLASEIMFFVAILGSYIIFRSGTPTLFAKNAETLNKWLAGTNTIVLIFSSLTMALAVDAAQKGNAKKVVKCLGITLLCAFAFMTIKFFEYKSKFEHYTFLVGSNKVLTVYDGHLHEKDGKTTFTGYKAVWPEGKPGGPSLFQLTEVDIAAAGTKVVDEPIDPATISQRQNYGPSKNIFFSSYFTLTGIHGLHVIGGIIPMLFLLVHALRGKVFPGHTEYVGLYWHFVDLVWIFLFPLLYLI